MKYMILLYASQQDYDAMSGKDTGKPVWSGEQLAAMGAFMESFTNELIESGEYVDGRGLAAPVLTRRLGVRNGAPFVTDGPYPETQEVLAGYTIIECESFDRATEIAMRMSECPPGPGGADGAYLDLRPLDSNPGELEV